MSQTVIFEPSGVENGGVGPKMCILFPIFPYTDVWDFTHFGNFGSHLDPQEPKYWFYRKMSHFKVVRMAILYVIEPKNNKFWQFSDFPKHLVSILENRGGGGSKPIFFGQNFFCQFFFVLVMGKSLEVKTFQKWCLFDMD